MGKWGVVLAVAVGVALAGCGGPSVPAAEQGGSSSSVGTPTPSSSSPAPVPSLPPVTAPSSLTLSPNPAPPVPASTTAPTSQLLTAQETAFLTQLKTLSAHVADGPTAVALGHKVCNQFGAHVAYDKIAENITGYNADDSRNVVTAAVITLCPQYKSLVGG